MVIHLLSGYDSRAFEVGPLSFLWGNHHDPADRSADDTGDAADDGGE